MSSVSYIDNIFYLTTKSLSYIFGINQNKKLYHLYFGDKILEKKNISPAVNADYLGYYNNSKIFLPEIVIYDGDEIFENTVKFSFQSGDRIVEYQFDKYEISETENYTLLKIFLKDTLYNLTLILNYKIYFDYDIISRYIEIINSTNDNFIKIENFFSGVLSFPVRNMFVGYLHGKWGHEANLIIEKINYGEKVIQSRTGNSSHFFNPSFFLSDTASPNEDNSSIFFGQIFWNGNWKFVFEKRFYDIITVTGGINNFDTEIHLNPSDKFCTPEFIFGYSDKGLGKMSRTLHDFYRDIIFPVNQQSIVRPIVYNNWEACMFDFDERKLRKLAETAGNIGIELFVLDDGWFGNRNDDTSSLGDWFVNKKRFPSGLKKLISYVKNKGMKFGLWIEPEMINPDSELYKNHSDWCYNFENRERTLMRNQLVLNLTKQEVNEYIKSVLKNIVMNYDVDYIKWDMNRNLSRLGADNLDDAYKKEVWIKHTEAVYELLKYVRSLKPDILIEGCSGGGGRFNGGILRFVDQIWTSDNTDAEARQFIQYGISLFYPAVTISSHVSDSPNGLTGNNINLEFRFNTSMAANFGIEANIDNWNKENIDFAKKKILEYKNIRDIIFYGDMYRINSPYSNDVISVIYVNKTKTNAVLFLFQLNPGDTDRIKIVKLKGLDEKKYYKVNGEKKSGESLMKSGIQVKLQKKYDSRVIIINSL